MYSEIPKAVKGYTLRINTSGINLNTLNCFCTIAISLINELSSNRPVSYCKLILFCLFQFSLRTQENLGLT